MEHGIDGFFEERARAARRVAGLNVVLSVALLSLVLLSQLPIAQHALRRAEIMRFGFEGPPRVVQLIQLEAVPGPDEAMRDVGRVESHPARRGSGSGATRPSPTARDHEMRGPSTDGAGEGRQDLLARALAEQGRVPIFQSDELVIEELVRPKYPEDARARGIEGRVAVLAHIDTAGVVTEAEVMDASGEPQLDHASRDAVMQCRFRPYRRDGETREVYAVFRFAFRIY